MNAPPPPRPPEPMATIWLARKPGAKPVDVIVGEAEAEQAIADLSAALAAIRAGKQAIADLLTPRGAHPYPQPGTVVEDAIFCDAPHPETTGHCELDDGHPGAHMYLDTWGDEVAWGDVVEATIGCPATTTDDDDNWHSCDREDGHPGSHHDALHDGGEIAWHYERADPEPVTGRDVLLSALADDPSVASDYYAGADLADAYNASVMEGYVSPRQQAAAVLAASIASGQPVITDAP